jgi:hypothetical protein
MGGGLQPWSALSTQQHPWSPRARLSLGGVRRRSLSLRDHPLSNPPLVATDSAVLSQSRVEAVEQRYPRAERPPTEEEIGRDFTSGA